MRGDFGEFGEVGEEVGEMLECGGGVVFAVHACVEEGEELVYGVFCFSCG